MSAIARIVQYLLNWISGNFQALIDWLLAQGRSLAVWAIDLLPEGLADTLRDIDFAWLASIVSDLTWIIPLWAVLGMYSACYATCALIRLVRWVLALIPTIGG